MLRPLGRDRTGSRSFVQTRLHTSAQRRGTAQDEGEGQWRGWLGTRRGNPRAQPLICPSGAGASTRGKTSLWSASLVVLETRATPVSPPAVEEAEVVDPAAEPGTICTGTGISEEAGAPEATAVAAANSAADAEVGAETRRRGKPPSKDFSVGGQQTLPVRRTAPP